MSVELYTDIDWDQLMQMEEPVQNVHGTQSFSIHCSRILKIQLGEYDDRKKSRIVKRYGREGCELQCAKDVCAWLRELENQVLILMQKNSHKWFGTNFDKQILRDMFKPLVTSNDSVVLRCLQNMRVYSMNKDCSEAKRQPNKVVIEGMLALPIIQIKGIWVEKDMFGLHVSMSDVLLFEEEPDNPFQKEELHDDTFFNNQRPPSPVGSVWMASEGKSLHRDDFFSEK
jgi:hypothetical protein